MATGNNGAAFRQLRTLFSVGTVGDLTDGQLLERFLTSEGDPAELAFACLVDRHGAMVLRVCQGVLANAHDAQDAFQATFLVLARRASALWVRDSLGPWLHQTAYRTALCARAREARRRKHERQAARPEAVEARPARRLDLERALHEEIQRLPERFRAPLVLCDLEGQSQEQASMRLGCPVGTIKSRLARGRERLRGRLLRRGLAPDAVATAPAAHSAPAGSSSNAVLSALTGPTAAIAARLLAGRGGIAAGAGATLSLAQGVIRFMFITQCFKAASAFLVVGAAVAGTSAVGSVWLAQADAPAPKKHARNSDPRVQGAEGRDAKGRDLQKKAAAEKPESSKPATTDKTVEVMKPGRFGTIVLSSPGTVEFSTFRDLYSKVGRETTAIDLVPEGTRVKKGDVVCELDSSDLRDDLVNQRLALEQAEADYKSAKLDREAAEIAVNEYKAGISEQERRPHEEKIKLAQSIVEKAARRLERTQHARELMNRALKENGGAKTPADILAELDINDRLDAAEQGLKSDQAALKSAKERGRNAHEFTKSKTLKMLDSEVEKARSIELAKQAVAARMKATMHKNEGQIKACRLTAPIDGTVTYVRNHGLGGGTTTIQEGSLVLNGQHIITIADFSQLRVNIQVPGQVSDRVVPKMEAFVPLREGDHPLRGTVIDVAPTPDPGFGTTVFTAHIQIDNPPAGLRPGKQVKTNIISNSRENVLSLFHGAEVRYDDESHVAVKHDDGEIEWRVVTVGERSGQRMEILSGLKSGEKVVLDPSPLLNKEQRAKVKEQEERERQGPQ